MARQLRTLVLAEDECGFQHYIGRLTSTYNSNSMGSNTFFWTCIDVQFIYLLNK